MMRHSSYRNLPLATALPLFGLLALGACSSSAPLTDDRARATATVLGCFPYGSRQQQADAATPTPTGTWATATPAAHPTLAPCGEPPCPVYQATRTPRPAWPPPAVTCTAAPYQPTHTPAPAAAAQFGQPQYPQPELPAIAGNTDPVVISTALGRALAGSITTDPRNGLPWFTWSQLNPDPGYEDSGRVYLKTINPASGGFLPERTINIPGYYNIEKIGPESAVAVGPDGRIHVIYVRNTSPDGANLVLVDYRSSADGGQTWDGPISVPDPAGTATNSLRIAVDRQNAVHVAYVTKPDGAHPGVIHYFEQRTDGSWRAEVPPVSGGERQEDVDMALVNLPGGRVRTVLAWVGDQAVLTAYKDGPDSAWSNPTMLIDGAANPYGIIDYIPSWTPLRVISFVDAAGRDWVYVWWSLYSTGRIAFAYSGDGGVTWGPRNADGWREDAISYYNRLANPTPQPGERSRASVHYPAAFWDPASGRLVVIYQFCDRSIDPRAVADCFAAYAYGKPGQLGSEWTGYTNFDRIPLRLFKTTYAANGEQFVVTGAPAGPENLVWLMWIEKNSADQVYLAAINPATLISAGNTP